MSRADFAGILIVGTIAAAVATAAGLEGRAEGGPSRVPVLVELFTSEGCSSCPPADELLTRLVATQPVAGAEIIALGEHVDYWDHLGWRDPFSSREFSERQSDYDERVFHRGQVYTPQMIVDGREEFTGSDAAAAVAAVKDVVRRPEPHLGIALTLLPGPAAGTIAVSAHVTVPGEEKLREGAEVVLALAEDGLESQVRGGENGGRRLRHSAVVRSLRSMGAFRAGTGEWSGASTLELGRNGKAGPMRVVVFVQEHGSRRILGVATADVAVAP